VQGDPLGVVGGKIRNASCRKMEDARCRKHDDPVKRGSSKMIDIWGGPRARGL